MSGLHVWIDFTGRVCVYLIFLPIIQTKSPAGMNTIIRYLVTGRRRPVLTCNSKVDPGFPKLALLMYEEPFQGETAAH